MKLRGLIQEFHIQLTLQCIQKERTEKGRKENYQRNNTRNPTK